MNTLYELTAQLESLLQMVEEVSEGEDREKDGGLKQQIFEDTFEALDGDFEEKCDGYAKVMRQMEADIAGLKVECDRLAKRKATLEGNATRMKLTLQKSMEAVGKTKFKTQLFSFGIQKNPQTVAMDTNDVYSLPEEFIRYRDPEVDKKAIMEALKAGEDLTGIAHLEQGQSLRIR